MLLHLKWELITWSFLPVYGRERTREGRTMFWPAFSHKSSSVLPVDFFYDVKMRRKCNFTGSTQLNGAKPRCYFSICRWRNKLTRSTCFCLTRKKASTYYAAVFWILGFGTTLTIIATEFRFNLHFFCCFFQAPNWFFHPRLIWPPSAFWASR